MKIHHWDENSFCKSCSNKLYKMYSSMGSTLLYKIKLNLAILILSPGGVWVGGWGNSRLKTNSAQLKLKLGLSLAILYLTISLNEVMIFLGRNTILIQEEDEVEEQETKNCLHIDCFSCT